MSCIVRFQKSCICVWTDAYVYGQMHMCMDRCICVWTDAYVYGQMHMCMDRCICVWTDAYVYGQIFSALILANSEIDIDSHSGDVSAGTDCIWDFHQSSQISFVNLISVLCLEKPQLQIKFERLTTYILAVHHTTLTCDLTCDLLQSYALLLPCVSQQKDNKYRTSLFIII